jgi:hypothetical protein
MGAVEAVHDVGRSNREYSQRNPFDREDGGWPFIIVASRSDFRRRAAEQLARVRRDRVGGRSNVEAGAGAGTATLIQVWRRRGPVTGMGGERGWESRAKIDIGYG